MLLFLQWVWVSFLQTLTLNTVGPIWLICSFLFSSFHGEGSPYTGVQRKAAAVLLWMHWYLSDGAYMTGRPMGLLGWWSLWAGCWHFWSWHLLVSVVTASLPPKGTDWTFYSSWFLKPIFSQEYPTTNLLDNKTPKPYSSNDTSLSITMSTICLLAHTLWQYGWSISYTSGWGLAVFLPRPCCCVWIHPSDTLLPSWW